MSAFDLQRLTQPRTEQNIPPTVALFQRPDAQFTYAQVDMMGRVRVSTADLDYVAAKVVQMLEERFKTAADVSG